jgi:hypothetical protein
MRESLLLERQSDNKVQLSQIESERLLAELVEKELAARKKAGPSPRLNPLQKRPRAVGIVAFWR